MRKIVFVLTVLTLIWLITSVTATWITSGEFDQTASTIYSTYYPNKSSDDNTATHWSASSSGGWLNWSNPGHNRIDSVKVLSAAGSGGNWMRVVINGTPATSYFLSNQSPDLPLVKNLDGVFNSTDYILIEYQGIGGWAGMNEIKYGEYERDTPPEEGDSVRFLNTDIFTNQTINPSNFNISYNDGSENVWYNETGTDGDIELIESSWFDTTIKVCSASIGYPEICNNIFIPTGSSVIVWQKLVPGEHYFPTPTPIGNVSTNITSQNLTEPFVLPNFTLVNKTEFRDQITNNSIIGNYTYGITSFMDELGDAVNATVQDTIEFVDVPFDFLIDIQLSAHNLYMAVFLPLIPFTYLPLLVTGAVVAVIPWQIQSLISLGLLIDLFYLMIRGSGGS